MWRRHWWQMDSDALAAIAAAGVLVVLIMALWPVLNEASDSAYSRFRDSCSDGYGNRFTQAYIGSGVGRLPLKPDRTAYYTNLDVHGGPGVRLTRGDDGACVAQNLGVVTVSHSPSQEEVDDFRDNYTTGDDDLARYFGPLEPYVRPDANPRTALASIFHCPDGLRTFYNEYGEVTGRGVTDPAQRDIRFFHRDSLLPGYALPISSFFGTSRSVSVTCVYTVVDGGYQWAETAPMLRRFAGINSLLLSVLPVVTVAAMLSVSAAQLYSLARGLTDIGSAAAGIVITMVGVVLALLLTGPVLGAAVDANQFVVSGQYQVNGTFGSVVQLLFGLAPVLYIGGVVAWTAYQAKSMFTGSGGGLL